MGLAIDVLAHNLRNHLCLGQKVHNSKVTIDSFPGYKFSWIREIVVGGSFFTINGLIFFFSHRLMKRRGKYFTFINS